MPCCPHCVDAEDVFSQKAARRDLRKYRKRGPRRSSRLLIDAVRSRLRSTDTSLLDIGGGVGLLQHELLREGLESAWHVDASSAYLELSRQEATRRGHAERVKYVHGDFVEVAGDVKEADVVLLDRVICCYPDFERLLTLSASKARHLYGLVFPRDRRLVRALIGAANLFLRLRRSAFRGFVHPVSEVERHLAREGFERRSSSNTPIWTIRVYERA